MHQPRWLDDVLVAQTRPAKLFERAQYGPQNWCQSL